MSPSDRLGIALAIVGAALVGIAAGLVAGPWPVRR